jgi:hypothetical protein
VARALPTPIPRALTPRSRAAVPVYQPEETTAELPSRRPSRPSKSRLALFLGRWTKSGRFVSQSQLSAGDKNLDIPRDPLARNILLVLAVALVTFLLTLLLVKLRHHVANPSAPASAMVLAGKAKPAMLEGVTPPEHPKNELLPLRP